MMPAATIVGVLLASPSTDDALRTAAIAAAMLATIGLARAAVVARRSSPEAVKAPSDAADSAPGAVGAEPSTKPPVDPKPPTDGRDAGSGAPIPVQVGVEPPGAGPGAPTAGQTGAAPPEDELLIVVDDDSTFTHRIKGPFVASAGYVRDTVLRRTRGRGPVAPVPLVRHPRVDAPLQAEELEAFEIVVGFRSTPDAQVAAAGGFVVEGPHAQVTCEVMPLGFDILDGDGRPTKELAARTGTIIVTPDAPFGEPVRFRLRAQPTDALIERNIGVVFTIGDRWIGAAMRSVQVRPAGAPAPVMPSEAAVSAGEDDTFGFDLTPPEGWVAPDLTVHLVGGNDSESGRFRWKVLAPGHDLGAVDNRDEVDLGTTAGEQITALARAIDEAPSALGRLSKLEGVGLTLARALPDPLVEVLETVLQADEPPSILVVSTEETVPWELLAVGPAPTAAEPPRSRFLGAQARLGRWLLVHRAPPRPFPTELLAGITSAAVVSGDYSNVSTLSTLAEATHEAKEVRARFANADSHVEAQLAPVLDVFNAVPSAQVIHVAMHGEFTGSSVTGGLKVLTPSGTSTEPLSAGQLLGGNLETTRPFVFLNACQVGDATTFLAQSAGFVPNLLIIWASAVIAPLWSVDDARARQLANAVYDAVLPALPHEGIEVAEALRAERARITMAGVRGGTVSAADLSVLAYQFFGHPQLVLRRQQGARHARVR